MRSWLPMASSRSRRSSARSYSGLFKLFFDVIDRDAFAAKPVLIAATGGTPRHSLAIEHAIRPLFAYLRAAVVPTGVYAATEDWGQGAMAADGSLVERIERAATELATAVAGRPAARQRDPFDEPVPFEDLSQPGIGAGHAARHLSPAISGRGRHPGAGANPRPRSGRPRRGATASRR